MVFTQELTTNDLIHKIPAGVLTNGVSYNISIATVDINGTTSTYSNPLTFHCFSTPVLSFTNISENSTIRNSNYQVTMSYFQAENELLQSYQIILYDASLNQVSTSTIKYDTSSISATFYNLEDDKVYKIKAYGKTFNGFEFETDYINFNVDYVRPSMYALLVAENVETEGYIQLRSNVKAIECKVEKEPPVFINDEYIDLRDNTLYIDEDFIIAGDFTLNIKGYNMYDGLIFIGRNDRTQIELYKSTREVITGYNTSSYTIYPHTYTDENGVTQPYYKRTPIKTKKTFFYLLIENNVAPVYVESNMIDKVSDNDIVSIWLTKKQNYYSINIYKV